MKSISSTTIYMFLIGCFRALLGSFDCTCAQLEDHTTFLVATLVRYYLGQIMCNNPSGIHTRVVSTKNAISDVNFCHLTCNSQSEKQNNIQEEYQRVTHKSNLR